ncbi:MAG TPA: lipoprotein-releasing ABC transporter permease subunit [Parvularculaceae bacterium]|nr:lipoprotein-releasing ABC transporter permease subunit [Parvularculaceae bacterium]
MSTATALNAPASTPPFSFFEWMVARRYLGATKSGKGVSLISIIAFGGILLAVAVLIIVMSVMQGFRAKLLDQLLGVNGHIFVQSDAPIEDYEALIERLRAAPGVTQAVPLIQAPVYASAYNETGIIMRAIRKEDLMAINYVVGVDQETGRSHVVAGSFDNWGVGKNGGNEIAIGNRVAWSLGVGPGDKVTLISGRGPDTPFGPTLQKKTYTVGAIFEVGNSEYDSFIGFMPLEQAQLFFGFGDSIEQIEIKVADPERVKSYKPALAEITPGMSLRDWQQQNQSYFNALQTERSVMRLILLLIVAVAALNIITGLIMLVKDKTGDIAVLRTMGATQGAIMRIFFLSGSLIGVIGTIAGAIAGALFVWNIDAIETFLSWIFNTDLFPADVYYFNAIPAKMQWREVGLIVGWSLFMSFVATIYPAWRAARLDPVEALRYE